MSKLTSKYQITIPVDVRNSLGIVPGSEIDIIKDGDRYVLVVNPLEELKKKWRGRIKDGKTTDEYIDEIRDKAY